MAKNAVSDWSTTAGSNSDIGGINIAEGCAPANINNAIREQMAQLATLYADLARLSATQIITGDWTISGNATFTANTTHNDGVKAIFGTGGDLEILHDGSNSIIRDVGTGSLVLRASTGTFIQDAGGGNCAVFTENGTVNLYHNEVLKLATDAGGITTRDGGLQLQERADHGFTPAAGYGEIWVKNDTPSSLWFTDDAGNDKQVAFAGDADITLRAEQATTSGTAFDFTSIPAGVNEITVMFDGISLSGTDEFLVQLGDSGGVETSGYDSVSGLGGATPQASTAGFIISGISASEAISGMMKLSRMSGNKWVSMHELHRGSGLSSVQGSGIKTLSAELTRVRLTRSGSNTFDAGAVAINYR